MDGIIELIILCGHVHVRSHRVLVFALSSAEVRVVHLLLVSCLLSHLLIGVFEISQGRRNMKAKGERATN